MPVVNGYTGRIAGRYPLGPQIDTEGCTLVPAQTGVLGAFGTVERRGSTVHDVVEYNGTPMIVMEFVRGVNLRGILMRHGALQPIADGLDEAGDVDLHRAARDAGGLLALDAAIGLREGVLLGEAKGHLAEVRQVESVSPRPTLGVRCGRGSPCALGVEMSSRNSKNPPSKPTRPVRSRA